MRDQISLYEKNLENQTSKASLTHISHNNQIQQRNVSQKEVIMEKRNLEKTIENKNKEIEVLNLRLQKLERLQVREVDKLNEEINDLKKIHQDWLNRQNKENEEWNR